jgi:serine protease AprX
LSWHAFSHGAGGRHRARRTWRKARLAAAGAAVAAALAAGSVTVAPAASAGLTEDVIVTSTGLLSPVDAVLEVGGTVVQQFHIINAVEAIVPTLMEPTLAALPGIIVTPNVSVSVQSGPKESTKPHTPSDAFLQQTGATQLAAAGDSGQGVAVAVLDTGIDNLPDLSGRLVGGVDFTGENKPFQDDYGHGTFVAGLIAGNGSSSGGQYSGEAPGSNLVSIKVAGASGVTTMATVIAGLQWAVDNQATYGIKVLNMSLGFQPFTSTALNPLDMASEATWNSGIAVVTSAGNAGPFNGTILSPGDDPLVITVGALDDLAQTNVSRDEMADFSSAGPTSPDGYVKPDFVTSGRSVVSLAAPGSTVYNSYPSARIGSANFVGSGTSFSAAIASGAAALVLADHPGLSPNQVKARLLGTTNPGPVGNPFVDGHGALNADAAATGPDLNYNQSILGLIATLLGSTVSLSISNSYDTWNASLWVGVTWPQPGTGLSWNSYYWNGSDWNGLTWNDGAWNGKMWNDSAWNGKMWNGSAWDGKMWNSSAWDDAAWSGKMWNSSAWD